MKYFRAILVIALATSCIACGTIYKPVDRNDDEVLGYTDETLITGERVANFYGAKNTSLDTAADFSKFRAIELCRSEGKKFADFHYVDTPAPVSVTRMSIDKYGGSAWTGKRSFPIFHTYYTCLDQVALPMVVIRELSMEDMKVLVKDLAGAIKIEFVPPTTINAGVLLAGDIILKVGGTRVETERGYAMAFSKLSGQTTADLLIVREEKRINVKVKLQDVTAARIEDQSNLVDRVCSSTR